MTMELVQIEARDLPEATWILGALETRLCELEHEIVCRVGVRDEEGRGRQ